MTSDLACWAILNNRTAKHSRCMYLFSRFSTGTYVPVENLENRYIQRLCFAVFWDSPPITCGLWFIYRHVEGVPLNKKFTRPSFLTKPLELKSTKWNARKLTRANRVILLFRKIQFSILYHFLCQGGKPSGDVWEWKNSIKIARLGCYGKHVRI